MVLKEVSVMIEVNQELDLLYQWSGNRKMKLELLYRGSRDGAALLDVHPRLQGRGPTFSFIKSELGLVFGFYTSSAWAVQTAE